MWRRGHKQREAKAFSKKKTKHKQEAKLRNERKERSDTRLTNRNQTRLKCMCGHVYLCVLAGGESVLVGGWVCVATVCILQSVFLTKRAAHPSLLESQTEHVSLTTAGRGQFLAGCDSAVVSPDINGGSLTEMSGCDGSILSHRREASVTWWGEGCWAIRDMSHTGYTGQFTIKIYYIPRRWNSHYIAVTDNRKACKSVGFTAPVGDLLCLRWNGGNDLLLVSCVHTSSLTYERDKVRHHGECSLEWWFKYIK